MPDESQPKTISPSVGTLLGTPPDRVIVWVSRPARTFGTEPADCHPGWRGAPIEDGWTEVHDANAQGIDLTDEDPRAEVVLQKRSYNG